MKEKIMKYVEPQNEFQYMFRTACRNVYSNIGKPHCEVCGDTEDDSELVKITYVNKNKESYLCRMCYHIQKNM